MLNNYKQTETRPGVPGKNGSSFHLHHQINNNNIAEILENYVEFKICPSLLLHVFFFIHTIIYF